MQHDRNWMSTECTSRCEASHWSFEALTDLLIIMGMTNFCTKTKLYGVLFWHYWFDTSAYKVLFFPQWKCGCGTITVSAKQSSLLTQMLKFFSYLHIGRPDPIHIHFFVSCSFPPAVSHTNTDTHHGGPYFKKMALISLDRPVCPLPQISAALPFHGAWPRRVIIPLSQVQGELMSEETDVPVRCLPLLPTWPPTPPRVELVTAHAAASPIWQHPLTNTRIRSCVFPPNYQFST